MSQILNLVGQRYGRLVATAFHSRSKNITRWLCRCDCGATSIVSTCHLRSGHTQSCGCRQRELASDKFRKHGHAPFRQKKTVEYSTWQRMRSRCHNPNDKRYLNYGGRGITICDRWRNDYAAFFADMGPRPSAKHSIDRINNDGNYEPDNCRWATNRVQSRNRSNVRWITYQGVTRPFTEWATVTGLSIGSLQYRLKRWGIDRALRTPPPTRSTLTHQPSNA